MMTALCLLCLLALEDKAELIQGASGSRSEQLEVQSGGLVLREGSAGAAFGTVQVGKGKRQLSYFLVLKHNLGKASSSDFAEEATAEEGEGKSKQTLSLDGKTLEVNYQVSVAGGKVTKQSLALNRKTVDLSRGRVFLVDLTASPPRWEQRKLDLPAEVPPTTTKKAADELVKKVLANLARKDSKAKSFIDSAGR